jgi:hypothetical protein
MFQQGSRPLTNVSAQLELDDTKKPHLRPGTQAETQPEECGLQNIMILSIQTYEKFKLVLMLVGPGLRVTARARAVPEPESQGCLPLVGLGGPGPGAVSAEVLVVVA